MGKRKLMLISPMLHQGGFERVCITTARLLEPYFDVRIVIFDSANIAYDVTGLSITDIQMGVKKGKLQKMLNILRRAHRVKQLKNEWKPDIAYSFGPTANLVNACSKTAGCLVWLGLRNYTDVEEEAKMRLFVRRADKILCCSKDIEREVQRRYGFSRTAVIYNLYDVEKIQREAREKNPPLPFEGDHCRYLVSMGRDDPMKGFWHMLKAFSLVHAQMPETRLILMGAGSFQKYRKLAEELGIADAIFFAGMQREPYAYLKYGEVYLLTSGNEGFPNALVEAMALSLAPVSVNCLTGPAEILTENGDTASLEAYFAEMAARGEKPVHEGEYGILLPAMDKEENLHAAEVTADEKRFAETVVALLQDEGRLQKYRQAACKRAQDFTYESYLQAFLQLAENASL